MQTHGLPESGSYHYRASSWKLKTWELDLLAIQIVDFLALYSVIVRATRSCSDLHYVG